MTSKTDEQAHPADPGRLRHEELSLRSIVQPNSVAGQFDFWDDRYEGRRLFSELLGTFFLVLVAVGGGMVNARFGGRSGAAAAQGTLGIRWHTAAVPGPRRNVG